jgi:CRISPR/Cas system-associated exonuclease Cas4 (RecB family)
MNLIQPILDKKAKEIQRTPCKSNRASGLGYFVPELEGCLRRGVYERTAWDQKELHDVRVQLIFDEGHHQERQVLADLASAGIDIIEQQSAFEWAAYQITGHLDGVVVEDGVAIPVEIKSMSPHIYGMVSTFEDFRKKPWTRSYMCQIMLYMLSKNVDKGIFVLKNKSTGELKQVDVSLDYELAEACIKTAETINACLLSGAIPDRITDREKCKDCPYKLICLPEISWGQELKIADDPEFEGRLNRYMERVDVADEVKKEYDVIRARCVSSATDGVLKMMVGKWILSGKTDARGAFRLSIDAA